MQREAKLFAEPNVLFFIYITMWSFDFAFGIHSYSCGSALPGPDLQSPFCSLFWFENEKMIIR